MPRLPGSPQHERGASSTAARRSVKCQHSGRASTGLCTRVGLPQHRPRTCHQPGCGDHRGVDMSERPTVPTWGGSLGIPNGARAVPDRFRRWTLCLVPSPLHHHHLSRDARYSGVPQLRGLACLMCRRRVCCYHRCSLPRPFVCLCHHGPAGGPYPHPASALVRVFPWTLAVVTRPCDRDVSRWQEQLRQ